MMLHKQVKLSRTINELTITIIIGLEILSSALLAIKVKVYQPL